MTSISNMALDHGFARERVVRVSVPNKIAFDLKQIQAVQASILDRLGCPACCSGHDIRFDMVREFVVDMDKNVQEVMPGGFVHRG